MKPHRKSMFISVEVAIRTDYESDAFVKWFEAQDLYVDKHPSEDHNWYIYFAPESCKNANDTILKLCTMIQSLPPEVKEDWDKAAHREFYAGYQVGDTPNCLSEHLDPATLEAAAAIQAGIGYALYQAPEEELDDMQV